MRRIAVVLCACIMIVVSLAAAASPQSMQYGHTYGGEGYEFETAIAVDSAGNIYIAGYSVDTNYWNSSTFLAKFDPSGNLLWGREVVGTHASQATASNIVVTDTDDVYVIGDTSDYNSEAFASKFTSDGSLVWSHGLSNLTYPQSLAFDPSTGGFAVAATLSTNYDGVVASFDSDGNWRWARTNNIASSYGLAVDEDGSTYSISDRYANGSYLGLTRFDSSGNVVSQKILKTPLASEWSWDLGFTSDGYLVGLGTQSWNDENALVAKLNTDLSPVWTEIISSSGLELDGYRLGLAGDGSIYVMCRAYGYEIYSNSTAIFHLDSSGKIMSSALYIQGYSSSTLQIQDIVALPGGGLVMGGMTRGTPVADLLTIDDAEVQPANGTWADDNVNWASYRVWLEADVLEASEATLPVDDFSFDMGIQAWWGAIDLAPSELSVEISMVKIDNSTFSFTANVSGGAGEYSYRWSFGDGTFSDKPSVTHTYEGVGLWWVQLSVNDSAGHTGFASMQLKIAGPPVIETYQNYPSTGAVGQWMYFYVSAYDPDGGSIVSYVWDFGDNSSEVTNNYWVSHIYQWSGVFQTKVTVTDSDGLSTTEWLQLTILDEYNDPPYAYFYYSPSNPGQGSEIFFDAGSSWDNDGWIEYYYWNFGDNTTGVGSYVNHSYQSLGTYIVTLIVTDNDGATSSTTRTVYVTQNILPEVEFSWTPTFPLPGETVYFNSNGTWDPDGWIAFYEWDFGDGSYMGSSWGDTVVHIYDESGTFIVTLSVYDNRGAMANCTHVVMVDQAPVGVIVAPELGKVGTPMDFSGEGSYDPDGSVVAYSWDFGDGGWAEGKDVSHIFAESGTFYVLLTVTDDQGASSNTMTFVSVLVPKAPVAVIGYYSYPIVVGAVCTFDGSASVDPDGSISTCIWQFGDGSVANGTQATHAYRYDGKYEVRLVVIDEDGLSSETTITVTVIPSKTRAADSGSENVMLAGTPVASLAGVVAFALALGAAGAVSGMTLFRYMRKTRGK